MNGILGAVSLYHRNTELHRWSQSSYSHGVDPVCDRNDSKTGSDVYTRRNNEPDRDLLGRAWITGAMVTKVQTGSITGGDSFETGPARVENRAEVNTTHGCSHSFRRVSDQLNKARDQYKNQ